MTTARAPDAATGTIVGMARFEPQDWERIVALTPDRDTMHAHYAEWLAEARQAEKSVKATGHAVRRVRVDPDQFAGWCALRGRKPDSTARAEFVADKLRQDEAP